MVALDRASNSARVPNIPFNKPDFAGKPEVTGKPALTGLANAATRVKNPTAQAAITTNIARKQEEPTAL